MGAGGLFILALASCICAFAHGGGGVASGGGGGGGHFKVHEHPIVHTSSGKLKGSTLRSRLGKVFFAFRGIPYAKAPTGELRFRPPVPATRTKTPKGYLDATHDGPICPQFNRNESYSNEDCLRLNVFTHVLGKFKTGIKRPVIVYFHPGNLYSMSAHSTQHAGPQYLMDTDVVLVTVNYRLGALGFLATGTVDSPGNAGFKDQVLAIKWVRHNIHKFGGNPREITLMGYGAGAMSVSLHLVSPMTRGLFQRAIIMSGSAMGHWDVPDAQLELAKRQARLVSCDNANITAMVTCMRSVDSKHMASTIAQLFDFGKTNPTLLWKPVVEPNFGQERFLIENPTVSLLAGRFHRVPIITGVTKDGLMQKALEIFSQPLLRKSFTKDFETLAPITFMYQSQPANRLPVIGETLQKLYGLHGNDVEGLRALANLFSDSIVGFGVSRLAYLASRFTKVYYYRNDMQGRFSHLYFPGKYPYGTVDRDDLMYLLRLPSVSPVIKPSDPESVNLERMTRMWSAFATTGDPNVADPRLFRTNFKWEPYNASSLNFVEMGDNFTMATNLFTQRYAIWHGLFTLPLVLPIPSPPPATPTLIHVMPVAITAAPGQVTHLPPPATVTAPPHSTSEPDCNPNDEMAAEIVSTPSTVSQSEFYLSIDGDYDDDYLDSGEKSSRD